MASKRPAEEDAIGVPTLKVKRLSASAVLPVRATADSAGYDLCASEDGRIAPQTRKVVKTDLKLVIPTRHYGRIAPRSGLSFKNGIDVAAGVIDPDYRGPVGIVLVNNGVSDFTYSAGDRVAQLLLERISVPDVEEVEEVDETQRGAKGFGSTGRSAALEKSNAGDDEVAVATQKA